MRLQNFVGQPVASDTARKKRARIHQGWWRAFVLGQAQGNHAHRQVASCLPESAHETANFISEEIGQLALRAEQEHKDSPDKSGIIEINRLKTNLLSSQPLCFNFFGMIALDPFLGLKVIQAFYPEIDEFHGVRFEYAPAPKHRYTDDNSAFDVALDVSAQGQRGLIGIECKYTEDFSPTEYDRKRYRDIYQTSSNFIWSYEDLKASRFNQLFRNQLIAESLLQAHDLVFVKTALFCAPDDTKAKNTAAEFAKGIRTGFKTIDFMEYLTAIQRQDIAVRQRQESMMLWARYIAYELSDAAASEYP